MSQNVPMEPLEASSSTNEDIIFPHEVSNCIFLHDMKALSIEDPCSKRVLRMIDMSSPANRHPLFHYLITRHE